jgi:hypothetical protein
MFMMVIGSNGRLRLPNRVQCRSLFLFFYAKQKFRVNRHTRRVRVFCTRVRVGILNPFEDIRESRITR